MDNIYPSGYNIVSRHELSHYEIQANDTLTITRIFVNKDIFPINGLYFSENLLATPPSEIVEHSIEIAGNKTEYLYYMESGSPIVQDYDAHYWIVDSPYENENIHNTIYPGDSVHFILKIIPTVTGEYLFPHHTSTFYADNKGFFSTADSMHIDVKYDCGNVNGAGTINILDVSYLLKYLYKGGPEPIPPEAGDANGNGTVNILDIVYLISYMYRGGPEPICPLN